MKIALGADHGGFELKTAIIQLLTNQGHHLQDCGCSLAESADYPDFANLVTTAITDGQADCGILICTTGVGMSMAANRVPGIRAALCMSVEMAEASRKHNDANVLVLGASLLTIEEGCAISAAWIDTDFSGADRHARRVAKIDNLGHKANELSALRTQDRPVYDSIRAHMDQEMNTINLIASENNVTPAVREAQGCVMTNKYAEGYPAKRWYNGCLHVDAVEQLAIDRACELFGADHANVQPHCGSSANMAVYFSVLQPGDTILAMSLDQGGHLTHGSPVNFSGRLFNFKSYGVNRETEVIDYDALEQQAMECKPKLIVAGASAYPRTLDFPRFRAIADKVGALLMVDMAHIAGLVAAGVHPSPVPYAQFVTTTTHKTLRGPRSGLILCTSEFAKGIDKTVFPGLQGGPQMHTTAAKAVCFLEAMQPEFKAYAKQIVDNAKTCASALTDAGFRIVSGGTDTHLMLVDVASSGLTGKVAASVLDDAGIVVNKNSIPFDEKSPFVTSGIRIGTPSVTTRGMGEPEMHKIAGWIREVLKDVENAENHAAVREQVKALAMMFPVP